LYERYRRDYCAYRGFSASRYWMTSDEFHRDLLLLQWQWNLWQNIL